MFTKFSQLEEWVADNGLIQWEFSTKSNFEDCVCRTDWFGDCSTEEKLEKCRKYVEDCGRKLYVRGYKVMSPNRTYVINEIQIESQQQPAQVGYAPAPGVIDENKLAERIRKECQMDFDRKDLERREKQLAEEAREFRRDKESAMGILVGYLRPLLSKGVAAVAGNMPAQIHGVDAPADVDAARIQAEQEEEPFTNEEAEELSDLMVRFKAAEPDCWLQMIRRVVAMAESGDSTYAMAKQFLCK